MKITFEALITKIDETHVYFVAEDPDYVKNALQNSRDELRMKARRIEYWADTVGKKMTIEANIKCYKRGGQSCTGLVEA